MPLPSKNHRGNIHATFLCFLLNYYTNFHFWPFILTVAYSLLTIHWIKLKLVVDAHFHLYRLYIYISPDNVLFLEDIWRYSLYNNMSKSFDCESPLIVTVHWFWLFFACISHLVMTVLWLWMSYDCDCSVVGTVLFAIDPWFLKDYRQELNLL